MLLHMLHTSTAELLAHRERFLKHAAKLVFKADLSDFEALFCPPFNTTKLRVKKRRVLMMQSRHLRDQAGEIFGRVDAINAELERREEEARPLRWLSDEARAAIRDFELHRERVKAAHSMTQREYAKALRVA